MKALPSNIVGYVIAALLALGVVLHAVFPRYDWRLVGDNGTVIVVHDRWSNRFQRAVYDDQGNVTAMKVYIPF
jgi:hypothetical protein